jgi:putative glycosyltransferase (TIGR04372 family)
MIYEMGFAVKVINRISHVTFHRLLRKFQRPTRFIFGWLIFYFLRITPVKVLSILKGALGTLFVTAFQEFRVLSVKGDQFVQEIVLDKSNTLALMEAHSYMYCNYNKIPQLIDDALLSISNCKISNKDRNQLVGLANLWAFWNMSHLDFRHFNEQLMEALTDSQSSSSPFELDYKIRYLPSFTTNFGHTSLLFFYANYHRQFNISKTIVLQDKGVPNNYYFNLLRNLIPLEIRLENSSVFEDLPIQSMDYLTYSLGPNGIFRPEISAAFSSFQTPFELRVTNSFVLKLSAQEIAKGKSILDKSIGGSDFDFVCLLHVREPRNSGLDFAQTRDCTIQELRGFCQDLSDRGGLVVRMGSKEFPPLGKHFPAFDYAHSEIRSEFMDCWLWSQAAFWVGNSNGALLAPTTFGTPRVLLNQYYYDFVGPNSDYVLPKRLVYKGKIMSIEEVMNMRLSRSMNRSFFRNKGISFLDASEEELLTLSELLYTRFILKREFSVPEILSYEAKKRLFGVDEEFLMKVPNLRD